MTKNNNNEATNPIQDTAHCIPTQATATFTDYLVCLRIDDLLSKIATLDRKHESAEQELEKLLGELNEIIESNRGGCKGIHGFIGERIQVYFSNVQAIMNGEKPVYQLIDDNGPIDYMKGIVPIQQKACQSDGMFGLSHVLRHAEKYPDFTAKGGHYQIPKDFYAKYKRFLAMPKETAMKLRKKELSEWNAVHIFNENHPEIKIESMTVTYAEIQAGQVETTVDNKKAEVKAQYNKEKEEIIAYHNPNLSEMAKVVAVGAALEGVADGVVSFAQHASEKSIGEFDNEDVKEIFKDTAKGAAKGAIRGGVTYVATNYYNVPPSTASAGVTVMFGIAPGIQDLSSGQITKGEFAVKTFERIFDAGASAISTNLGKKYIHHPLGGLIGGIAGTAIYNMGKIYFKKAVANKNEELRRR